MVVARPKGREEGGAIARNFMLDGERLVYRTRYIRYRRSYAAHGLSRPSRRSPLSGTTSPHGYQ